MSEQYTLTRHDAGRTAKLTLLLRQTRAHMKIAIYRLAKRLRPSARSFYYAAEQRAFATRQNDLKTRGRMLSPY